MNTTYSDYVELCRRMKIKPEPASSFQKQLPVTETNEVAPAPTTRKAPSKTELEYARTYLRDKEYKWNPITFHMENGLKYTPDYYIPAERLFVEVKGSYRLHSHGRSILAYNQCRVEFSEFNWKIAMKTKEGWQIK